MSIHVYKLSENKEMLWKPIPFQSPDADFIFSSAKVNSSSNPKFNSSSNSTSNKIILLNHEDDTTVPVLEIEKKYMDHIYSWYEQCNLILDIESTLIEIPNSITKDDLANILYKPMNYSHKDEFIHNYIPLIFKTIIANNSIRQFEEKFSINAQDTEKTDNRLSFFEIPVIKKTKPTVTNNIGIIIPENINSDSFKDICISTTNDTDTSHLNTFLENNYGNNGVVYNNVLSEFSMNSELLEESVQAKLEKEGSGLMIVLLNVKNYQTIVLDKLDDELLFVMNNHTEFGFMRLFGILTNNNEILHFVRNEFHQIQFNDIDEINKRISVTSQYIEFSNKHMRSNLVATSEENQVKSYILNCYVISDDLNYKIKSSVLYDAVINSNCVFINPDKLNGFKNRFSKYLKDIHLNKKRYNDGYYYYGIRLKQDSDYNQKLTDSELEKYIQERKLFNTV